MKSTEQRLAEAIEVWEHGRDITAEVAATIDAEQRKGFSIVTQQYAMCPECPADAPTGPYTADYRCGNCGADSWPIVVETRRPVLTGEVSR